MLSKILDFYYALPCKIGWHDWMPVTPHTKRCFVCGKKRPR